MKKLLLAALLLFPSALLAQTTLTNGTITDANGQVFANGNYTITFYPSPTNPHGPYFQNGAPFDMSQKFTGNLSAGGSFSGVAIPSNNTITPSGSQWSFSMCSQANPVQCTVTQLTVTGVNLDVSGLIHPAAIAVNVQGFPRFTAYQDSEIVGPQHGVFYLNLLDNLVHICNLPGNPCTWTAVNGTSNGAVKPSAGDALCWVTTDGNDANDGLSWGSAKLTLGACYDTPAVTTIYVANKAGSNGIQVDPGGGDGLCLMGPNDLNYPNTSIPTTCAKKWRIARGVNIIGVSGDPIGGNNSNIAPRIALDCGANITNVPCVWVSGYNGPSPIYIANLALRALPKISAILGLCSDGTTNTTCPANAVTFENVNFLPNGAAGSGPAVLITGNSALWDNFKNCGFQGTQNVNTPTNDDAAGLLIDGRGNAGANLVYIEHANFQLGGIKYYPGSSTGGFTARDVTCEDLMGAACVWATATGAFTYINLDGVNIADNSTGVNVYNVEVDGNGPPDAVACKGCGAGLSDNTGGTFLGNIGPMINEGNSQGLASAIISPSRMHQSGFMSGNSANEAARVIGRSDSVWSTGGPVAVPYTNIALQLPASWTDHASGAVIAGSKAFDRDGTTNAGQISGASSVQGYFYDANQTNTAGDIYIYGAAYRSSTANGYSGGSPLGLIAFGGCATFTDISGNGSATSSQATLPFIVGDGQWERAYRVFKVTTAVSNPCETGFFAGADATHTIQVVYPVLFKIPTGTISDNEAAELAMNLTTYPDNATAGYVTTRRRQPFSFGGTGDDFLGLFNHTALSANRTYTWPDASGTPSLAVVQDCGTTTACAGTVLTLPIIVKGTVALSSATPSTATLTGLPFTSSTSYVCTVTEATDATKNLLKVVNATGASTVITGPDTITDTIGYVCVGN